MGGGGQAGPLVDTHRQGGWQVGTRHYTALFSTVLKYTVLCYTVLYCTVCRWASLEQVYSGLAEVWAEAELEPELEPGERVGLLTAGERNR